MRSVKAIFKKQLKDTIKNPAVLAQFFVYPLIAFMLGFIIVTEFNLKEYPIILPNQL